MKRGAPVKIDPQLMDGFRMHMSMQQVTRLGDPRSFEVRAVMKAAIKNTALPSFSDRYAWDKLRARNPETLQPSGMNKTEDLRAQFTTWQQLNDWFTFTKPTMIESDLAEDKEQVLPGRRGGYEGGLFYFYYIISFF